MDFGWNCLLGKFQPSQLFIHHVVGDAKLDAQEKMFANDIQRVYRVMQSQHNVIHGTSG